jgi:hypothetical protein
MKKQEKKRLSFIKNDICKLNNLDLIRGGDDFTTGETKRFAWKCVKTSKEQELVIVGIGDDGGDGGD